MVYVLVRAGWEYNDEYYYKNRDDNGYPIRAYEDLADAEAAARAENIQECKDLLSSDADDIMCHLGEGEIVSEMLAPDKRWGRKISAEDSERLLSYFDVKFGYYYLDDEEEVPIGISKSAQSKVPDEDWLMLGDYLGFNSYSVDSIEYVKSSKS